MTPTATAAHPAGSPPRHRSPALLLVVTVTATTVALGLATGTGTLLGPLAGEFAVSTGVVSLMFSATLCVMLATGVLTGPLAERHGPRRLALLGAVLVPAGLLVTASADSFAAAGAGFALGVGGGAGCLFVPLLTAVGTAFGRHRGPALVLATAGGGAGVVLAPPASVALVATFGLRPALLALAAGAALVLLVCAALTPPGRGVPPVRTGPPVGTGGAPDERRPAARHLLRERGFRRLYIGSVGLTAAMFVPFVHLPAFAAAYGLGPATGAGLVALSGLTSLAGRLAAAPAVARYGAWVVYRSAAALLAAALGLWLLGGDDQMLLAVFAVVFGIAHGAYVGLSPAVAVQLYGADGLGLRLGVLHTAAAAGGLLGPAAAGLAVDVAGTPTAGVWVAIGLGLTGCAVLTTVRPNLLTAPRKDSHDRQAHDRALRAGHRRPGGQRRRLALRGRAAR
ncbi:MFS transporter [Pseudonocardia parietis]|uniref:MFS family permease n=1 Tax=Pseudonocardia parietis TaxID=570936 RepID=A0ABS4VX01_9PSEU|nr:MFS transporter [Pseudonocardia parietis]MBP2368458.1 MFS family permease [Pseudonocardia parietis]